ncbi:MAG: 4-hydroxy-tetrahydrodipicolinate reductase [Candidatus Omnitrophica bacterium]|jgi:4-hydroxy-tetrahydrodipicolinate reductase|nr:4-hydroxy-tetrahydrodipicolinate reductase [Candidatus Omnitrophota bacterium]
MLQLAISGFCGKMGQRIFALARSDKNFKVVVGLERKGHPQVGKIVDGVRVTDNLEAIKECDCVIDFTIAVATLENLPHIVKYKKCAVIGTTGLDMSQQEQLEEASKKIAIVFSPNMSVGVNLLFALAKTAASTLRGYKVLIEEAHHIHKKDAPSGTAKRIAQIINEEGLSCQAEDIRAIREGEIVGDHRIILESEVDRIELFHHAKTRDIFVKGALIAARWVVNKKTGLYSMDDVLSDKNK